MAGKARTIYIYEGPDTFTIVRGYDLKRDEKIPYMFNTKMKWKGMFKQYFGVRNIDQTYIGEAKKLIVDDEILSGWQAIRIKKDFLTHEPYVPDISPHLAAQLKSLRNELEIWKRKYFDSQRLAIDRDSKDRYRERVVKEFEFVKNAKDKLFSENSGWSSFGTRYGLPGFGVSSNTSNEE